MNRAAGHTYRNGRDRPPEILPPGQYPAREEPEYYVAQPPPTHTRPPRRSHWAMAPATYTLVGINCLVYLWMCLRGISWWSPNVHQLVASGADVGYNILVQGQWWRLFTAMFVHAGIIHIAGNMWCLWNLGLLGEPLLGPLGVVAVYVLTGLAGDILSTAIHPNYVSVGASGAVFGIAGVLIVLLKSPLLPIPRKDLNSLRRSVIYFAVLNFIFGAGADLGHFVIQIDNMAHFGGFVSGILLGLPMVPRIGSRPEVFKSRRKLAIAGMSFLLLLMAFGMYSFWMGHAATPGGR